MSQILLFRHKAKYRNFWQKSTFQSKIVGEKIQQFNLKIFQNFFVKLSTRRRAIPTVQFGRFSI